MTSRTKTLRVVLPPPDAPEPTALSGSLVALIVIFARLFGSGRPCILYKSLRLSKGPPDTPSPFLRHVRFAAPAETPPAETPAAERPSPTSIVFCLTLLVLASDDVAPIVGSKPRSATVEAAKPLPPCTSRWSSTDESTCEGIS